MDNKKAFIKDAVEGFDDYLLVESVNLADTPYNYFKLHSDDAWDIFEEYATEKDIEDALSGKYEAWELFADVLRTAGWQWMKRKDFEENFGFVCI